MKVPCLLIGIFAVVIKCQDSKAHFSKINDVNNDIDVWHKLRAMNENKQVSGYPHAMKSESPRNATLIKSVDQIIDTLSTGTRERALTCGDAGLHYYNRNEIFYVKSQNFPKDYPNNLYCSLTLLTEANARFRFRCRTFHLQKPKNKICGDYLQLDNSFYCGKVFPKEWISASSWSTINFRSNKRKNFKGFFCKVKAISVKTIDTTSCSNNPSVVITITPDSPFTATSPNYPSKYPNYENCGWYIQGQDWSTRLSLSCEDFNIQEMNKDQCKDYLAINEQKFCGAAGPTNYITNSAQATLWFASNRKLKDTGFKCTASAVGPSSYGIGATSGCKCGRVNRATRIIGGTATEVNEYPWQVSLINKDENASVCGGSIINNQWILTAAHCVSGDVNFHVGVGAHSWTSPPPSFQIFEYDYIQMHHSYNPITQDNDLALIKLVDTLDFSDPAIGPICPPSLIDDYIGINATVAGWGYTVDGVTLPDELHEVELPTISHEECAAKYFPDYVVSSNMLCTEYPGGGKDSCQGDSGGPLIAQENDYYVQIGVVSWGVGCGLVGNPGVYAKVANQMLWINGVASTGETCPK